MENRPNGPSVRQSAVWTAKISTSLPKIPRAAPWTGSNRSPSEPTHRTRADPSSRPKARHCLFAAEPRRSAAAVLGMVTMLWAAGVLFLLARLLHGWWSIARLRRRLQPRRRRTRLHRPCCAGMSAASLNMRSATSLAAGGHLAGRASNWPVRSRIGIFRPLVILPQKLLGTLDSRGLRDVLVHEFAHALRRDPLVGFLQRLAAIVYWPYPPVHFLNRRLARRARKSATITSCGRAMRRAMPKPCWRFPKPFCNRLQPAALGLFHPRGKARTARGRATR